MSINGEISEQNKSQRRTNQAVFIAYKLIAGMSNRPRRIPGTASVSSRLFTVVVDSWANPHLRYITSLILLVIYIRSNRAASSRDSGYVRILSRILLQAKTASFSWGLPVLRAALFNRMRATRSQLVDTASELRVVWSSDIACEVHTVVNHFERKMLCYSVLFIELLSSIFIFNQFNFIVW